MFDMQNVANKLSDDSKNIKLDTTVNPIEIQADIMKKMGKCQNANAGSFSGGYVSNPVAQNPYSAYSNQNVQYQYPSVQIPPQAYQGQYVYNYGNWQQPNVQNAYAMQQDAYNQQMQAQTMAMPQAGMIPQNYSQAPQMNMMATNPAAY